jgi:hypothetical protein
MAKRPTLGRVALTARERTLLFCSANVTHWQSVGITRETVTALIVRGLLVRNAAGPSHFDGAVAGPMRRQAAVSYVPRASFHSWEIVRNPLKLQGRFCPRSGKNYS